MPRKTDIRKLSIRKAAELLAQTPGLKDKGAPRIRAMIRAHIKQGFQVNPGTGKKPTPLTIDLVKYIGWTLQQHGYGQQ